MDNIACPSKISMERGNYFGVVLQRECRTSLLTGGSRNVPLDQGLVERCHCDVARCVSVGVGSSSHCDLCYTYSDVGPSSRYSEVSCIDLMKLSVIACTWTSGRRNIP